MQKWWSILFGLVILAEIIFVLIAPMVGWGLPANFSSYGPEIDNLFHIILAITGVAFLLTEGVLVYNLYRFAGENGRKSEYSHGNHRLEMLWSAVPAVILLFISFAQIGAWERIKYVLRMPDPDQVFEVNARQFEWRIRYPSAERMKDYDQLVKNFGLEAQKGQKHADDVHVVNEVHIWKGAKVKIQLKTRDVIHSFFLPNLRIKQDALPGKTIPVWFDSQEANTRRAGDKWEDGYRYDEGKKEWVKDDKYIWELACAELCGWGHYKMRGKLYVHESKEDYLAWLAQAARKENQTTTKE